MSAIPAELTSRPQWVVWQWEERDGKRTKPPYNPHTGSLASSTDQTTWATFQEVMAACESGDWSGVGYVFTGGDPFAGVDLDDCVDPFSGEISGWARAIIDYLGSYAEVSPSQMGIKVFVKGRLPDDGRRRHGKAIEMYDRGRYFTVTGEHLQGTPTTIEERTTQLVALHAWLFGVNGASPQPHISTRVEIPLTDREIIDKAMAAANGARFAKLWEGDWSDYPTQSEADLALANHLAFWTGGDADRMDRLFRQSGLFRDKWDERHYGDGRSYGQETITKALQGAREFYGESSRRRENLKGGNDHHHGDDGVHRGEQLTFPRTDAGNGELFAHLYADRVRYDHRRRRWLRWVGHWWAPDADAGVRRLAKAAARHRYQAAPSLYTDPDEFKTEARWAISSESRMRQDATLTLAQAERPIADTGEGWDGDPWLLGCANGVLDMLSDTFRAGRPDDKITMHSPIAYDPDAPCPRWLQFLLEVFADDEEMIDYIQRACGYNLTGITREQCHFLCYGEGWNGKGTFQTVQREILGDYASNTPFSTLEASSRYSIPNDLAALYGKRLVTASELNESVRLNEARLKMLAGEDPVTARFLHGEFFTFLPAAKFWLAVNHRPIVNDDSTGFWRKIRLIPFTQSFKGRADLNLKDALRAEYPGVLAWMVEGCLQWQKRGLDPPESVLAATQQYREESDPIAAFLQDGCVIGEDFTARAGQLYIAYRRWAQGQGLKEKEELSNARFGRLLTQRFPKDTDKQGIFYRGIGLVVDHQEGGE